MMMLYLPSGSPTVELFAASYNNTEKSKTITLGLGKYGYTENTSSNWFETESNHEIYNKNSSYWWLASPYYEGTNDELLAHGSYGKFGATIVHNVSNAVRPLVCIPTSVFNSKYATVDD